MDWCWFYHGAHCTDNALTLPAIDVGEGTCMNSKYQFINGRCCESLTWTSQRHDLSKFCSSGASAFSSGLDHPPQKDFGPHGLSQGGHRRLQSGCGGLSV